jgi:hypothetical protein
MNFALWYQEVGVKIQFVEFCRFWFVGVPTGCNALGGCRPMTSSRTPSMNLLLKLPVANCGMPVLVPVVVSFFQIIEYNVSHI